MAGTKNSFFVNLRRLMQDSAPTGTGMTNDNNPKKRKASHTEADPGSERPTKRSRSQQSPVRSSAETQSSTKSRRTTERRLKERRAERERRERRQNLSVLLAGDPDQLELKYQQQDVLGAGGFGSVYAGVRRSDQLPVAIKRICAEHVELVTKTIKGQQHWIPAEVLLMCRAGSGPRHVGRYPWVSLLNWFCLDREVVLVMERPTPSEDLHNYNQENGPLPEQLAKDLTLQLVKALCELHQKGVFHRDIKMENILIQETQSGPRVRLIDLGCGCRVRTKPYTTFTGTDDFAPPEFVSTGQYSAAPTTVWQIGAVLYELVRPDELQEFSTEAYMSGPLPSPHGLSQDGVDFLEGCLRINQTERLTLESLSSHRWFRKETPLTSSASLHCPFD